jgi:hypothetical protein
VSAHGRTTGTDDGFVVIQSAVELDVVALYTAAGSTGVSTMAVERVPPRRMQQ